MSRMSDDWRARLIEDARHTTVRHRDHAAVFRLTITSVVFLFVSFVADLLAAPGEVLGALVIATILSVSALFAFLFSRRFRTVRRPIR